MNFKEINKEEGYALTLDDIRVPLIQFSNTRGPKKTQKDGGEIVEWMKTWLSILTNCEACELLNVNKRSVSTYRKTLGIQSNRERAFFIASIHNDRCVNSYKIKNTIKEKEPPKQKDKTVTEVNEPNGADTVKVLQEEVIYDERVCSQIKQKKIEKELHREHLEMVAIKRKPLKTRRRYVEPKSKCISNCWVKQHYPTLCTEKICYHDLSEWETNRISHPSKNK